MLERIHALFTSRRRIDSIPALHISLKKNMDLMRDDQETVSSDLI
jgi:hypothetical protein